MNILFLLRLWPVYGGGETVTICLANEMARRGWNVSVAYFKDSIREQMPYIHPNVKAVKIEGVDFHEFSSDNPALLKCEIEKVRQFIVPFILENHVDVVMNQWWPLCFVDYIRQETGAKLIKVHHTAFYTPILDVKGLKGAIRHALRPIYEMIKKRRAVRGVSQWLPYVDRYVFLSPQFQHQFEQFANYDNGDCKLDAIPNPLVFEEFISDEDILHKEKTALIVGRMWEAQKKISRALRAWATVEADSRSNGWHLEIVGEGPSLPMYRQMAKDLGLQRVSFEGYRQPLSYYRRASLFLMTSQFEGWGMTLIESQQQGVVPVVMDSFLSLHDIIENGRNGIIVPNKDEAAFAEALLRLMDNPQQMAQLQQESLKSCRRFCVEKVVDQWQILIENIPYQQ